MHDRPRTEAKHPARRNRVHALNRLSPHKLGDHAQASALPNILPHGDLGQKKPTTACAILLGPGEHIPRPIRGGLHKTPEQGKEPLYERRGRSRGDRSALSTPKDQSRLSACSPRRH